MTPSKHHAVDDRLLPGRRQRNETRRKTTDFDNQMLMLLGMRLRVQELIVTETVRLQHVHAQAAETAENRLQYVHRDILAVKDHVHNRRVEFQVIEPRNGIEHRGDVFLHSEDRWIQALVQVIRPSI